MNVKLSYTHTLDIALTNEKGTRLLVRNNEDSFYRFLANAQALCKKHRYNLRYIEPIPPEFPEMWKGWARIPVRHRNLYERWYYVHPKYPVLSFAIWPLSPGVFTYWTVDMGGEMKNGDLMTTVKHMEEFIRVHYIRTLL